MDGGRKSSCRYRSMLQGASTVTLLRLFFFGLAGGSLIEAYQRIEHCGERAVSRILPPKLNRLSPVAQAESMSPPPHSLGFPCAEVDLQTPGNIQPGNAGVLGTLPFHSSKMMPRQAYAPTPHSYVPNTTLSATINLDEVSSPHVPHLPRIPCHLNEALKCRR
jgi:hypothetical protein